MTLRWLHPFVLVRKYTKPEMIGSLYLSDAWRVDNSRSLWEVVETTPKATEELGFELERRLPQQFIPRYSMVMFHAEIPYSAAQSRGTIQSELLEKLTRDAEDIGQIDIDAAEQELFIIGNNACIP